MDKLTKLVERLENIADRLETNAIREKSSVTAKPYVPQPQYTSNGHCDPVEAMAGVNEKLNGFVDISNKIGGDVAKMVLQFIVLIPCRLISFVKHLRKKVRSYKNLVKWLNRRIPNFLHFSNRVLLPFRT